MYGALQPIRPVSLKQRKRRATMKKLLAVLVCLAAISVVALLVLNNLAQAAPQGPWAKYAENPVLSPGDEGEWDQNGVYYASVISDGASYKMWYTGYDSDWVACIGFAESPDGVNWTKHISNPVLGPGEEGSWDSASVDLPAVVKTGSSYRMWYAGRGSDGIWRIGYATSTDGTNWTKHAGSPVLEPGPEGTWDDTGVGFPTVLFRAGQFHMWYQNWWSSSPDSAVRVGYATSSDGVSWTKSPENPVLAAGPSDSWEHPHVFAPTVIFDADAYVYRMWYASSNPDIDAGRYRFGYAVSSDGAHWTKYSLNPVFYRGEPGSWDARNIDGPCVILEGETYKMWYSAYNPQYAMLSIGYATAEPGASVAGHVYDQSVDPLPGARIYALDNQLDVIAGAVSGADGGYAILDLPSDEYYLEISADGYGREYYDDSYNIQSATPVSVTLPFTTAGIDFALSPEGAVSGHVHGPGGATPFAGAAVELDPTGGGRALKTTSASDGSYQVDGMATGNYNAWAGHSSYLADSVDTPVSVTQPNTTAGTDFSLLGPYFPLRNEGDTYHYTWSNDTRHPEPIPETWQIMEQNWEGRSGYAISAYSEMTLSKLWFQDEPGGVRLSNCSVWDRTGLFPNFMVGVGTHLVMPFDVMKQPLTGGATWTGPGWQGAQATSTVLAVDETVAVAAGTFTDALRVHTVITGTNDYMSGQRDAWFAPGVGLIKLVYNHEDGSTTTAELAGGPYSHHIHLPLATRNYQPGAFPTIHGASNTVVMTNGAHMALEAGTYEVSVSSNLNISSGEPDFDLEKVVVWAHTPGHPDGWYWVVEEGSPQTIMQSGSLDIYAFLLDTDFGNNTGSATVTFSQLSSAGEQKTEAVDSSAELTVYGASDTVVMTDGAHMPLEAGTYEVSVSSNLNIGSGDPALDLDKVVIWAPSPGDPDAWYWVIQEGSPQTITWPASGNTEVYAFLLDTDFGNNVGSATVTFTPATSSPQSSHRGAVPASKVLYLSTGVRDARSWTSKAPPR